MEERDRAFLEEMISFLGNWDCHAQELGLSVVTDEALHQIASAYNTNTYMRNVPHACG
jgi:hypothetical protein